MSETKSTVCETCQAKMPAELTGPNAQAAFEETTHLGVLIREHLGPEWADVYLVLQSGLFAMLDQYEPERFTL